MRYYSCDSHVVEAAEIYDGLTDRFGDRAPFIEKDYNGKPGTWLVLPGGMQTLPAVSYTHLTLPTSDLV